MKTPDHFIVVDDDPVNNMLCQYTIKRFLGDARVTLFQDPEIALESILKDYSANGNTATLLFLDINMPSLTGWEFLEIFKNYGEAVLKQFTIYILSSSVDSRDKERAGANPLVSGFLSKPLTVEAINGILYSVIRAQNSPDPPKK